MTFILFCRLAECCFHIEAILLKQEADLHLDYNKQACSYITCKRNNELIKTLSKTIYQKNYQKQPKHK